MIEKICKSLPLQSIFYWRLMSNIAHLPFIGRMSNETAWNPSGF